MSNTNRHTRHTPLSHSSVRTHAGARTRLQISRRHQGCRWSTSSAAAVRDNCSQLSESLSRFYFQLHICGAPPPHLTLSLPPPPPFYHRSSIRVSGEKHWPLTLRCQTLSNSLVDCMATRTHNGLVVLLRLVIQPKNKQNNNNNKKKKKKKSRGSPSQHRSEEARIIFPLPPFSPPIIPGNLNSTH